MHMDKIGPLALIQFQMRILESLFGRDWFVQNQRRKLNHPAYKRWILCNKLMSQYGILRFPEDYAILTQFGEIMLDGLALEECSGRGLGSFELGNFANYGDASVRKRIHSVKYDPDMFQDLLVELNYAAWHISHGDDLLVLSSETKSLPDFKVKFRSAEQLEVLVECKRIQRESEPSRIRNVIKSANKQIKSYGESLCGLVVIDVGAQVTKPSELSGDFPREVVDFIKIVTRMLSNYHTSVSAVLLVWGDYLINENLDNRHIAVILRKRSHLIFHPNAKTPLPKTSPISKYGRSFFSALNLDFPDRVTIDRPQVGIQVDAKLKLDAYLRLLSLNSLERVLTQHIRSVIRNSDTSQVIIIDDGIFELFLKLHTRNDSTSYLMVCTIKNREWYEVMFVLRLLPDFVEKSDYRTPLGILVDFCHQFCVPFRVNGGAEFSAFILYQEFRTSSDQDLSFEYSKATDNFQIVSMKHEINGNELLRTISFAFAIDLAKYENWLADSSQNP